METKFTENKSLLEMAKESWSKDPNERQKAVMNFYEEHNPLIDDIIPIGVSCDKCGFKSIPIDYTINKLLKKHRAIKTPCPECSSDIIIEREKK